MKSLVENPPAEPVGESWEIADHGADVSVITNGEYKGRTLREMMPRICGKAVDPINPHVFPLILKIIEANKSLSVQVHPDDEYAGKIRKGEMGKTEAWYVLSVKPGGKIYYGLKDGVTKADLAKAIEAGDCARLLEEFDVKTGDVAFIPSGTVHTLGEGVTIVEIQQNSDTTYRLYDWGRVGLDGLPRELNIKDGLAVSTFNRKVSLAEGKVLPTANCRHERYIDCEKFRFEKIQDFAGNITLNTNSESFHIITVVAGSVTVCAGGEKVVINKLDSCLVPYSAGEYTLEGDRTAECLLFYRPTP